MASPPQPHLALTAPPPPPARRLPPPCWSHDETAALIAAYRRKWYSLRRGNLRAADWQDVADAVATKTPIQCRHKMEKLRKRYRNDLARARARPAGPVSSSWVHFESLHAMEKGADGGDGAGEEEDEDDEELYQSIRCGAPKNGYGETPGFRIKIPTDSGRIPSFRGSATRVVGNEFRENFSNFDPNLNFGGASRVVRNGYTQKFANFDPNHHFGGATRVVANGYEEKFANFDPNPGFGVTTRVAGNGYEEKIASFKANPCLRGGATRAVGNGGREKLGKRKERGAEEEAVEEMVAAVRALGNGFVRIERMKMDMAREVEAMRMDMEMKRTEMILESQQRIVEAFASTFPEKKAKRMGSPES